MRAKRGWSARDCVTRAGVRARQAFLVSQVGLRPAAMHRAAKNGHLPMHPNHSPKNPAGFSIAGGALWASLVFCLAFAFYIATGASRGCLCCGQAAHMAAVVRATLLVWCIIVQDPC